jgi:hypothetical protein
MQNLGLWCARLTWAVLPISVGNALADALRPWSSAPASVAAALLWVAWALGLVALFAPRPWGLTALRVVAPAAVVVAVATAPSTSGTSAFLAISSTILAVAFALAPPVALAAGNALAYGDELRFPLRIPTPLLLAPVPVALIIVAGGIAAGPLLLADGRVVAGVIALVAGLPLAAFLTRSVHALSRRWLVMVPAGVVVVDPLILVDPALMQRPQVRDIGPTPRAQQPGETLDLRLGTVGGSVTITLNEAADFARRRGRADGVIIATDVVLVAPIRRADVLATADTRHLTRR